MTDEQQMAQLAESATCPKCKTKGSVRLNGECMMVETPNPHVKRMQAPAVCVYCLHSGILVSMTHLGVHPAWEEEAVLYNGEGPVQSKKEATPMNAQDQLDQSIQVSNCKRCGLLLSHCKVESWTQTHVSHNGVKLQKIVATILCKRCGDTSILCSIQPVEDTPVAEALPAIPPLGSPYPENVKQVLDDIRFGYLGATQTANEARAAAGHGRLPKGGSGTAPPKIDDGAHATYLGDEPSVTVERSTVKEEVPAMMRDLMTLRDNFAGLALQALVSIPEQEYEKNVAVETLAAKYAAHAYVYADAMMKHREPAMTDKQLVRERFRQHCLARDNSRCRCCGTSLARLDVHHIRNRVLFPNGGYVLANGITLCDRGENGCHYKAEMGLAGFTEGELYAIIGSSVEEAIEADI